MLANGQARLFLKTGKAFVPESRQIADKYPTVTTLRQQPKTSFDPKFDAPNNFISNNIVSNNYITYLCGGIIFEHYGEQTFYIRSCHIWRQLY